ncbi:MAG TPA: FAD-binding protein, partial [bacterium]|nr:FAD-binding protein [bacterium]
ALGGTSLDLLVGFLVERGLGGLENLAGIPGTVGGAIYGNAGAYGSCISDRLLSATLLGKDGAIREATPAEMSFEYRHSILKESGEAVLEAIFETAPANRDELRNAMNERKADRARKHPDPARTPTAGSWFKNIKDREGNATPAGRLLEEAGCCELNVGGASLWPSHANIIVTDGNASWFHVDELVSEMKGRVKERFGIDLVEEVSRIGF